MRTPEFWYGHGLGDQALGLLLSPLGALYDLAGRWRFATTWGYRAKVPVICVGNLTAGGSGKTPVAIALARLLLRRHLNPMFLTRGYRGRIKGPELIVPERTTAAETGDEALLLAQVAPTIVSANRAAGAKLAESSGAGVIIMDDGFQNPGLRKDVSLVVVDGPSMFGNGFVLPAGPLRETAARGLARAQAVILMGSQQQPFHFPCPVLHARIEPEPEAAADLRGRRLFAFAGIGRPAKFFDTLGAIGAHVLGTRAFPDHHPFSPHDIGSLYADAEALGAQLVTTSKDWVRLDGAARAQILTLPVHVTFADPAQLVSILEPCLTPRR